MSIPVEEKPATHEGLGTTVRLCMGVFDADDSMIGSREPECPQGAINVLIRLFRRFGLISNVEKSKTKTCQPGVICTGISEEGFSRSSKVGGATYRYHLLWHIPCTYCGVELMVRSITDHHIQLYGMDTIMYWD